MPDDLTEQPETIAKRSPSSRPGSPTSGKTPRSTSPAGTVPTSTPTSPHCPANSCPSWAKSGSLLLQADRPQRPVRVAVQTAARRDQRSGQGLRASAGGLRRTGSALTYYRRYILSCLTGAVADDDDDGTEAAHGEPPKPRRSAKVTGQAHERLRQGTVEAAPGDHPASRGTPAADEDLWAGEPAGDFQPPPTSLPPKRPPLTRPQQIARHFNRLGITDDEERHNWIAKMAATEPGPT